MGQSVTNTYLEGMNKDIDRGLISNKAYLEANNFRIVTTDGSTTGSLENIKGNKTIIPYANLLTPGDAIVIGLEYIVLVGQVTENSNNHNSGDFFTAEAVSFTKKTGYTGPAVIALSSTVIDEDQLIIGGIEVRDQVVLFTTDSTGSKSCIYKMGFSADDGEQSSLTKIYDDNLNAGGSSSDLLNFSTSYPIKAISRYENSNIQKVYWTDGNNVMRYVDIGKNLTISGEAYSVSNLYMTTDKFNLSPNLDLVKPFVSSVISGTILPGMVQYTFQLYRKNGSATTFSPLSNIFHITEDNDYAANDLSYLGSDGIISSSGKGCRIEIDNSGNTGFERARVIRIHYATLNGTPSIDIIAETAIETDGSIFYVNDVGDSLGSMTTTELQISSTELFKAQDIATKDNKLFVANIENEVFDVTDFDSRAVRFRNYTGPGAPGSDTTGGILVEYTDGGGSPSVDFVASADDVVRVTIIGFTTLANIPSGRSIADASVTAMTANRVYGTYTPGAGGLPDVAYNQPVTEAIVSYTNSTDTLIFDLTCQDDILDDYTQDIFATGFAENCKFEYDFTDAGTSIIEARVQDEKLGEVKIERPTDPDDTDDWDAAGWDEYALTHDGINQFNDPDNEYIVGGAYDPYYAYQYQEDGSTLGAEGPNITIGFTTEGFVLDDDSATANDVYYSIQDGSDDNPSFESYSSPWRSGERSFQRQEVYRFSVVYHDEEGRSSFPQWICDLKFPSAKDTGYETSFVATDIYGRALYPTFTFRSLPTGAVSAQIYVAPREAEDRSVYTQGLAVPFDTSTPREQVTVSTAIASTLFKLVSPEVMINQNIPLSSNDFLDYLGEFTATAAATGTDYTIVKLKNLTGVTADEDNLTTIDDTMQVSPTLDDVIYSIGGVSFMNYDTTNSSYGCTGLMIEHDNASWDAIGDSYCLVNYRKNVFNSQYGGNTYNSRTRNYYRPCSDMITDTSATTAKGGDTFINFFDVSVQLYDLGYELGGVSHSEHETVYVPLESSINCNLRHDNSVNRFSTGKPDNWQLIQEIAGEWEDNNSNEYSQSGDLYQYNSVYSQIDTLGYKFAKPLDWTEITTFDTMIKASNTKINGELADSWTVFPTNDFIEIDSEYGPVNAIYTFNNNLYYFQDSGVGIASVNPRSLIQDNSGAGLVLGTGGVLDRYDYLSQEIGSQDKFSIVKSKSALYWFDRINKSLYKLSDSLLNISKSKYIQSHIEDNYQSTHLAFTAFDKENDEILFTMYPSTFSTTTSYTLVFNELLDVFPGFYDIIPTLYIPFKNRLLYTTDVDLTSVTNGSIRFIDRSRLFVHNSGDTKRCYFWGFDRDGEDSSLFEDSNIEFLFNPDYDNIKVFDNFTWISNAWDSDDTIYDETFDTVQCYNDYQNTTAITLTYGDNLMRRERKWSTYVPRNAVDLGVASNPTIATDIDLSRTFRERMRGNYLITNFVYNNDATYDKFVASNVTLHYRKSYR